MSKMMWHKLLIGLLIGLLASCSGTAESPPAVVERDGTLEFVANGEDFIRQGFTAKDGWAITFDRVLVHVSDISAYQSNPPYEPDKMKGVIESDLTIPLPGTYIVDLAEGDENAAPILVGEVTTLVGRYNALGWQMTPASEGEMQGYSLLLSGTAEKEGERLTFTIGLENSYSNLCGEYVGDARKGILAAGSRAELEMTFHFDHIFGNAELPADDSLNKLSPGFAPFAAVAKQGVIDTDLGALQQALAAAEYQMLVDILPTLGHTGEGHCFYGL